MAKKNSSYNAHWGVRIIAVLIVSALMTLSIILFEDQINKALGLKRVDESEFDGNTSSSVIENTNGVALTVHFIDVGQGDACVIQFPDYKTMLIDGAEKGYGDTINNYISENIKDKNGNTITKFDYALLTHADSDHCGSMSQVLTQYPCDVFYRPNVKSTYKDYIDPNQNLLTADCAEKSTLAYKNVIEAGTKGKTADKVIISSDNTLPITGSDGLGNNYSLTFYGPISDKYKDWNNYSPIMILEYNGIKMAMTGDCEKEGEQEFVEMATQGNGKYAVFNDDFHCAVIKAGHHGSRTSTGTPFVNTITKSTEIKNTLMVISCGFDNSYGHPHAEKLEQFKQNGFQEENVLRTDKNGTIVLSVNSVGELFYGASPIVKTPVKVVDWRYIAISIAVAFALVVLIYPAIKKARKAVKAEVRQASRSINDYFDGDKRTTSTTSKRSSTRKSTSTRKSSTSKSSTMKKRK